MLKVGELIRWRSPLDADYSYGTVVAVQKAYVIIRSKGYYEGLEVKVHISDVERHKRRRWRHWVQ